MSKRDESNKEKTPSSYNLPSTPISATTTRQSQLASNTIANTYLPSIQFPNNEEPGATSHLPLSGPRSTNQGLKNDAQAVADLLALADASSNSPPSYEEPPPPSNLKRGPSPPSPDVPTKRRRIMPPTAGSKKTSRSPTGEPLIQFVPYLPPQQKRKQDVIFEEQAHSAPTPGPTTSPLMRTGTSPTHIPTAYQPPHIHTTSYTQAATIAPGPFSSMIAPQVYVPHISLPPYLPPVPAPTNVVPYQSMFTSPWPAVTSTSYQIPPTLEQQFYAGPPLSLEQLTHQTLLNIIYPSGPEHVHRLLKICLPDQPLNFFKTNVEAPVSNQEPQHTLRPFMEPPSEAIESLPHFAQVIQSLEVPLETQRSTAAQKESTRGPPKKLPLHFVQ